MKKILCLLIIVTSLSVGCNKNNETLKETVKEEEQIVYCSECASKSNELSKYCKDCGKLAKWVTEKPQIKEEEETNEEDSQEKQETSSQEKQETSKEENNKASENKESDYSRGYKAGYKEGYYRAQVDDVGGDGIVANEYDRGFSDGYNDGWMQCVADGKDLETKQKEEAKNNGKIYGSGDECPKCGEIVVYWDKFYYWETEENRYECSKCGITYYEY